MIRNKSKGEKLRSKIITVRDLSRKVNILSKVAWDRL